MKLVAYEHNHQAAYGVLSGNQIIEIDPAIAARHPDLRAVLDAQALPALAASVAGKAATLALADVTLLPPLSNPRKMFCVGLNYKSHVAETKRPDAAYPSIFVRFADTLIADGAPLLLPVAKSQMFDYEGELAVVIGKGGSDIAEADALAHVAGYACFNDGTVRDWQRHTHQWTPGKNFPGTGAFGPVLVTADEIADITAEQLTTRLNGAVVQQAPLSDLIFTLPVIIAYLSRFTALSPGDVIATGTPGGVGDRRDPPAYLQAGDVVEVEISGIGRLRNVVHNG